MAESRVFSFVADELERCSALDRLQSRGTVRLALKQAGLDAADVTAEQMAAVLQKILPGDLEARGIGDTAALCERLATGVSRLAVDPAAAGSTPEAVFARLGGG